jgi:hypothetical protein
LDRGKNRHTPTHTHERTHNNTTKTTNTSGPWLRTHFSLAFPHATRGFLIRNRRQHFVKERREEVIGQSINEFDKKAEGNIKQVTKKKEEEKGETAIGM